jgi:hypothetical protein
MVGTYQGLCVGKGGKSFVALGRQQKPFQILAKALTLSVRDAKIVEFLGVTPPRDW